MASLGDVKISLRKLDYPMCAVEALSRLGLYAFYDLFTLTDGLNTYCRGTHRQPEQTELGNADDFRVYILGAE